MILKEVCEKYNVSDTTIRSWIPKGLICTYINGRPWFEENDIDKFIKSRLKEIKCEYCGKPVITKRLTQKCCSEECRENMWKAKNPDKWKQHQKNYRNSIPVICRSCREPIPTEERTGGKMYCNACLPKRMEKERLRNITYGRDLGEMFRKYKEGIGCKHCGYSKFGGCLDFHHLDPSTKERRVDCGLWKGKTELFEKEAKKCILLCKNCHYEEHERLREEKSSCQ